MKHLIELWESDEFTFSGETMNPKLESLVKKLRTNEAPYTGLFSIPPYCRTPGTNDVKCNKLVFSLLYKELATTFASKIILSNILNSIVNI